MIAAARSAPARFPSQTMAQLRKSSGQPIRFDALAQIMRMFPVKSSAPQQSTSTNPKQKHKPPTTRWAPKGSEVSPKNVQKYMAPKAMNAPASMADTKHLTVGRLAFVHPMVSAFASVAAGDKASGVSADRSSLLIGPPPLRYSLTPYHRPLPSERLAKTTA